MIHGKLDPALTKVDHRPETQFCCLNGLRRLKQSSVNRSAGHSSEPCRLLAELHHHDVRVWIETKFFHCITGGRISRATKAADSYFLSLEIFRLTNSLGYVKAIGKNP